MSRFFLLIFMRYTSLCKHYITIIDKNQYQNDYINLS
nr:MAG TPA: hypothetical protein [Caudoviricetes sp.]